MLFQSRLCSDVKSTQELIVFCYGQERVLIPLPKTYETAQARARDVFGLQGDIEFETADLHGSVGDTVRIHNTAWEGISPVLHTVSIKLKDEPDNSSPTFVGVASSPSPRISAQKRANISSNAGPSRLAAVAAKSPNSASIKRGLTKTQHPRGNYSTGSCQSTVNVPSRSASSTVPKTEPKRAPSPPPAPRMKTPVPSDDEEEEEIRIPSPTKKRVQRPRILSDYGLDGTEPEEENGEEVAQSDEEHTEEEHDELDDTEYASAAAPSAKKEPPPSSAQGRGPAKFKPAASLKMGKGSQAETDGTRADQQPSPKIKVEKVQGKAAPAHPEAIATTQSQGTSDESFLVMIEYDKKPDSPSLFKTRGRHMVSKVLMQACRTFEIEEFYDKARLVLLVDDGEQVYRSVCRRNATMAEAGAEPDARFIVEIDE